MLTTIPNTNTLNMYVIKLDARHALLPSDYTTLLNILFCRRFKDSECNIRNLTNNLEIQTLVKRSFTDSEDDKDESFLLYFRFNEVELPRSTSDLISVDEEKKDKLEWKRLNRSKYFHILRTFKIQTLSVPEQHYLKKQI